MDEYCYGIIILLRRRDFFSSITDLIYEYKLLTLQRFL